MAPWLAADTAARYQGVCSGRLGQSRCSCASGSLDAQFIQTCSCLNHYISKAGKVQSEYVGKCLYLTDVTSGEVNIIPTNKPCAKSPQKQIHAFKVNKTRLSQNKSPS